MQEQFLQRQVKALPQDNVKLVFIVKHNPQLQTNFPHPLGPILEQDHQHQLYARLEPTTTYGICPILTRPTFQIQIIFTIHIIVQIKLFIALFVQLAFIAIKLE